jgi:hypothetical protein
MKREMMSTKPTRVPITSAEPHDFATPPHCKARIKQTSAARKMNIPGKSICRTFSLAVAFCGLACLGVSKMRKSMAAERPPTGRLM